MENIEESPNKSSQLSLAEIKKRTINAFLTLSARQVLLRGLSFVSVNLILARALPIETLGIFNIATAIVTFFAFFSDVGLAASLIQKKDEIKQSHITTTFTIQQGIVLLLSLIIVVGAPYLASFYNLDASGTWLIRALGVSFFLSSLKVIPSVLLERELKFQPVVLVELVETLLFNGLLLYFGLSGYGIWSFTYAVLARGLVGVILIYILAPVKVAIGFEKQAAKELLSFGVPYQLSNLLALLKDRLVPLVLTWMIGTVGLTYITWAQSMAFLPFEIMNMVIKITFPAFSRLQHDKEALARAVEKSLFVTSLSVFPAVFGIAAILPSVVSYVVGSKFEPALLTFYLFVFSTFLSVISNTFTNVLNAIGQVKLTLKLMVFWTVITWILTPALVYVYGFVGAGMSAAIISLTSVVTIVLVKRILTINVLGSTLLPFIASSVMAVAIYLFAQYFVRDIPTLILSIILGGVLYLSLILALAKNRVLKELKNLRNV